MPFPETATSIIDAYENGNYGYYINTREKKNIKTKKKVNNNVRFSIFCCAVFSRLFSVV